MPGDKELVISSTEDLEDLTNASEASSLIYSLDQELSFSDDDACEITKAIAAFIRSNTNLTYLAFKHTFPNDLDSLLADAIAENKSVTKLEICVPHLKWLNPLMRTNAMRDIEVRVHSMKSLDWDGNLGDWDEDRSGFEDKDYVNFDDFRPPMKEPANSRIQFIFEALLLNSSQVVAMTSLCKQFDVKVLYLRITLFKPNSVEIGNKDGLDLINLLNVLQRNNPAMKVALFVEDIPKEREREAAGYFSGLAKSGLDSMGEPPTFVSWFYNEEQVVRTAKCFSSSGLIMRRIALYYNCAISKQTVEEIGRLIRSKPMLEHFLLSAEREADSGAKMSNVSILADSLNNSFNLKKLTLCDCNLRDQDITKFKDIFSRLEELSLRENLIGDPGAIRIAEILANSRIKSVDLRGNSEFTVENGTIWRGGVEGGIRINGVKAFVTLLSSNTTLIACKVTDEYDEEDDKNQVYIKQKCEENKTLAEHAELKTILLSLTFLGPDVICSSIADYCLQTQKRDTAAEFKQFTQTLQSYVKSHPEEIRSTTMSRNLVVRNCVRGGDDQFQQILQRFPGLFFAAVRKSPKLTADTLTIIKNLEESEKESKSITLHGSWKAPAASSPPQKHECDNATANSFSVSSSAAQGPPKRQRL